MTARNGETSKTQAVRDALTTAARPLNIDELQDRIERKMKQIIGRTKLYQLLAGMIKDGELDTVGRGASRFYWFKKEVTA